MGAREGGKKEEKEKLDKKVVIQRGGGEEREGEGEELRSGLLVEWTRCY